MVDLGAHKCIPCKMMAPIIKELQKEYTGRASIIFIDVWEHRDQARRFGIRSIPTQIFYDKAGREVRRHVGFMDKKSIVAIFEQLGVPKEGGQ
jgi:thioredoxin 1